MYAAVDPVKLSVCGLTGAVHDDYRSEIVNIEDLRGGLRRIHIRLTDSMPKPEGTRRRPSVMCRVITPYLEDYYAYRYEMWDRIEHGGSLFDITLPMAS